MKKERGDKMEWTNILKRKRSKHHSPRKIRRGRTHHQRANVIRDFARKVPISGRTPDEAHLQSKKDKPELDYEEELADATREDLIEILGDTVKDMSKEDIIDVLVNTKGKLEDVKLTGE